MAFLCMEFDRFLDNLFEDVEVLEFCDGLFVYASSYSGRDGY